MFSHFPVVQGVQRRFIPLHKHASYYIHGGSLRCLHANKRTVVGHNSAIYPTPCYTRYQYDVIAEGEAEMLHAPCDCPSLSRYLAVVSLSRHEYLVIDTTPPPVFGHRCETASTWPSILHHQYEAVDTTSSPVFCRLYKVTSGRPSIPRIQYLAVYTTPPLLGVAITPSAIGQRKYTSIWPPNSASIPRHQFVVVYTTAPPVYWPPILRHHQYTGHRYHATSTRPSIPRQENVTVYTTPPPVLGHRYHPTQYSATTIIWPSTPH